MKSVLRRVADAVHLVSGIAGLRIRILRQKVVANFGGRGFAERFGRRIPQPLYGGFEAGQESFAGFATIEVLLQPFTKRIIELFVQIVG